MKNAQSHLLSDIARSMEQALPSQFERSGATFNPWVTLTSLLHLVMPDSKNGYESFLDELAVYNEVTHGITGENQGGTFSRARYKFSDTLLEQALKAGSDTCHEYIKALLPKTKGYRLIAIDGCRLNVAISRKNMRAFKSQAYKGNTCASQPQALIVAVTDAITREVIAHKTVSCRASERKQARELIQCIPQNAIVLLDSGFPARYLVEELERYGLKYIMRMIDGSNAWVSTKEFQKKKQNDAWINITHDGYNLRVRYVELPKKKGRPTKKRKYRSTILMTNLSKREWSARQLGLLYKTRWGIEIAFREMKHVLTMKQIHARKPKGVKQEIACACMVMTLIATLELLALHNHNKAIDGPFTEYNYRANRKSILKLIQIIVREMFGTKRMQSLWKQLMRIGARARPVEKGRSYPRICKSVDGLWRQKQRRR